MPSTYTQNLGIEMPADGEQAGTWGDTVNNNYSNALDVASGGDISIAFSSSVYALVTSQGTGSISQGNYPLIFWTGTLAQQATVNVQPNTAQKIYTMVNNTQGGFAIAFQQGTGGTFLLQPGYGCQIYCNGAGPGALCGPANYNPQLGNVLITGTLTVQGAATYAQAATFTQLATFNLGIQVTNGGTFDTIQLTNGSPAPYDLYYRSAGGWIIPLHLGAPGQALVVLGNSTLGWGTTQVSVGTVISGSIPTSLFFANISNQFVQDANIAAEAGVGIGLGLKPSHTLHIGYAFAPEVWLDSSNPAASSRGIYFATNGAARWSFYTPLAAESGGNAGSNLQLISYNDPVNIAQTLFTGFRASGDLTVGAAVDLGAQLGVVSQNAATPGMIVRGAAGQTAMLQTWQNSAGTVVASIDPNGVLTSAGGAGYLTLDANGRLNLHGNVPGAPWGTIQIAPEGGPVNDTRGTIAFQNAQSNGNVPANICRIYYRSPYFVIQFYYNGTNYYAYLSLVGQVSPNVSWAMTTTPL